MITHIYNRGERPVPVDAWVVVALLTGRSPELAYLASLLFQEIASTMGDYFDNSIGESMPLQEWVSLFEYFKGAETTKIPVKENTLAIIMQSDEHVTPLKRRIMENGMPPDTEYRDLESLCDWLREWS